MSRQRLAIDPHDERVLQDAGLIRADSREAMVGQCCTHDSSGIG